jgi:HD-GYP domain-containing protein (c-di-GMP phosphodiesterase class II)
MPLNRVVDGAELGKDIPSGRPDGMPLLRAGSKLSPRFKDALRRAGIHAVYIRDHATEGIEPKSLLTAETRAKATHAVSEAFKGAAESFKTGKPLKPEAIEQLDKIAQRMAREVSATSEFAVALADLSGSDSYTMQHSVDVAAVGLLIGQRLFQDRGYIDYRGRRVYDKVDNRLTRLGLGLLLHDIGKLAIPTEILNKPGQLDEAEWQVMKTHPVAGTELLRSDLISPLVKVVVRSHHERWDGRGYPDGKAGTDIHELARIAAVADVYDAVTSERVYAAAKPAHTGVRIIREGAGEVFDTEVVDVFRKIVAPFPPGDEIELSDGRAGVVAEVPEHDLDRPVVRVIGDGSPYDLPLIEHPRIKIVGWENMAPDVQLPAAGSWAI